MKRLFDWLADLATRRAKLVVAVCCLIMVAAGVGAAGLHVTFRMRVMYDYPGNPFTAELDRYNEEFGDDASFTVVVVEAKEIFTAPVLRYIQKLSRKLQRKPHFRRIMSLAVDTIPRGNGDEVVTGRLFDRVPEDQATLRRIRKVALSSRVAVPRLVSKDGRYAMVAAEFKKAVTLLTAEEEAAGNAAVREAIDSTPAPPGVRVVIGGMPVAEEAAPEVMVQNQKLFLPVGIVLIIVVMWLSFGSFHGVLLTFAEVILTLMWTMGLMGVAGLPFTMMSASTPTILMIYGLLDSMFVMAMFYKLYGESPDSGDPKEEVRTAMRTTIRRMGPACLLTSSTTAIGFLGFAMGKSAMITTFGIGLSAGVIFAFVSSILWMPALACLIPPPKKQSMRQSPISRVVARGLTGLAAFTGRWRVAIVAAGVVLLAGSGVLLATQARVSNFALKELPQDMEGIEGINLVADHLLGAMSTGLEVTGKPGSMKDPKVLKALDQLDTWAERQAIVKTSLSPSDLIRDMHRAFNGGGAEFDKVPDDRGLISQYLALLDPTTRSDFVTDDYAKTHLRIMTLDAGSLPWRKQLFEPLEKKAKELLPGYGIVITGYQRASAEGDLVLVKQMVLGFFIAFAVIAILLGLAFRSVRLGLLSVLPNLLPTALAMAVVVAMGTSLRVGTVLFLSVAVGITFDNTIHLFAAMREARARGLTHEEAMRETLTTIGPPIVYTSLLITAGLGIFMLSSFMILVVLGMTSALVVLIAAGSDLLLTTAIIQWAERLFAPRTPPDSDSSGDEASA